MDTTEQLARELDDLFEELDQLLKNADMGALLTARGVNSSLAMLALDGLRAYLAGKKEQAADDLGTAAEEIATRLGVSRGTTNGPS
jgi:hypothetical protein